MQLGSIVELLGANGDHACLNSQRCAGRHFLVVGAGVGAIYHNEVECDICHMRLRAYENSVVDPFAAAIRDTTMATRPGIFRLSLNYRFIRMNMNGSRSDPEVFFAREEDARAILDNATKDAALAVWRAGDQELLQSVTVSLCIREGNPWKEIGRRTFPVTLAAVRT